MSATMNVRDESSLAAIAEPHLHFWSTRFILSRSGNHCTTAIIHSHRKLIEEIHSTISSHSCFASSVHAAACGWNNLEAPMQPSSNGYRLLHGKEAMQEKSHTVCAAILQIADFIASEENNT
jgi:hypothetical protein